MKLRASAASESVRTEPVLTLGIATPIGRLYLAATSRALVRLELPSARAEVRMNVWLALHFPLAPKRSGVTPILKKAATQIENYFTAGLADFSLPLELWGTPFQTTVWKAVAKIPAGETRSYADIAAAIGRPRAVRAVGAAQAANPLPILIPCHRVIGTDGTLTGYAGGLDVKQWLLEHEASRSERRQGTVQVQRSRRPPVGPVAKPPSAPPRA
jgi:O-6-methylguanine DNA methyltransferase